MDELQVAQLAAAVGEHRRVVAAALDHRDHYAACGSLPRGTGRILYTLHATNPNLGERPRRQCRPMVAGSCYGMAFGSELVARLHAALRRVSSPMADSTFLPRG